MPLVPSTGRINPEARFLVLVNALLNFSSTFYYVALSVYLSIAGFSPATIGLLLAAEAVVGVALAIPMAMLSDLYGRKIFLLIAILVAGAGGVILSLTLNLALVFLAAVLFGLGNALGGAPASALFAEKATSESSRNEIFAFESFSTWIASAIGAFVSGLLPSALVSYFHFSSATSFRPLFALGSLFAFSAAGVLQLAVHDAKVSKSAGDMRVNRFLKVPRKSMSVVMKFSVLGLIGLGAGLVLPLFPLWFYLRFGLDISVIGPLFGVMNFVTGFASLLMPTMARKTGSVSTIVLTQISSVPILAALPFSPNYALAGAAMVSRNMLMNVSGPIQTSYQMGLIAPDERATALSIIHTFDAVPRSFAPAIGGYLFSLGLLSLPFLIMAGLYTVSISSFYFLFRKVRPPDSFATD